MTYLATGTLRAIQLLLGYSKFKNTVRYLSVDIEDTLLLCEPTEICFGGGLILKPKSCISIRE